MNVEEPNKKKMIGLNKKENEKPFNKLNIKILNSNSKRSIKFISVEYPASLLRGWKTSPITVNDNMSSQFHFLIVKSCSN